MQTVITVYEFLQKHTSTTFIVGAVIIWFKLNSIQTAINDPDKILIERIDGSKNTLTQAIKTMDGHLVDLLRNDSLYRNSYYPGFFRTRGGEYGIR